MLLCSPLTSNPFRTIKLRPRRKDSCRSCGDPEKVGEAEMLTDLEKEDYRTFCGLQAEAEDNDGLEKVADVDVKVSKGGRWLERHEFALVMIHILQALLLSPRSLLSSNSTFKSLSKSPSTILLDVRPSIEFGIANLPSSTSESRKKVTQTIPFETFLKKILLSA